MAETAIADIKSVPQSGMKAFEIDGRKVAVANAGGSLYAFDDTCTHRGCSLAKGHLSGTTVTCPCHGSQFDVRTGAVVRGPAQQPVRSYLIDAKTGTVRVEG